MIFEDLETALIKTDGNMTKAAELLGISRETFRAKLEDPGGFLMAHHSRCQCATS